VSGVSGFFRNPLYLMAYKVIARKFRPQTFEEVIGQPHVTRTLVNSIRESRIAHAFLFAGERGVGKTSVARILAKALNCHQGMSERPCGTCSSCSEIAAGTSIDVHEIDGASNRGVDDIRALRENVRYHPTRDRYKVFIIDEVHMLTDQAFNALLKTLEEPPPYVVFILATTEPQKIPDTIISRCLRFDFRRIPLQEIVAHLDAIAQQENLTISRHSLYLVAREAEGSMRDAQSILERAVAYCGTTIDDATLQEMLGHIDRRQLFSLLEGLIAGSPQECIAGLSRLYEAGVDLHRCYYAFLELLRDALMLKTVPDQPGLVEASDEDVRLLRDAVDRISGEGLQRCVRFWLAAEPEVTRSANPKTALEICLLEMLQVKDSVPLDELLERIEQLQRQIEQKTPAPVRSAPHVQHSLPADAAPPERMAMSEGSVDALLDFIARKDSKLGRYLRQTQVSVSDDGMVRIAFPVGNFIIEELFKEPETEQTLRDLCQLFFQQQVNIVLQPQAHQEKKKTADSASPEQVRKKNEQKVLQNPVIQNVLKTFNGKIVAIHTSS